MSGNRVTIGKAGGFLGIDALARICYDANYAFCAGIDDAVPLPFEQVRSSIINGIEFSIANPEATPEDSHDNWLRAKYADGWTYGEVKDADAKTHPCMRPYGMLPVEQRAKDDLFQGIVKALIPSLVTHSGTVTCEDCDTGLTLHAYSTKQLSDRLDAWKRLRRRSEGHAHPCGDPLHDLGAVTIPEDTR